MDAGRNTGDFCERFVVNCDFKVLCIIRTAASVANRCPQRDRAASRRGQHSSGHSGTGGACVQNFIFTDARKGGVLRSYHARQRNRAVGAHLRRQAGDTGDGIKRLFELGAAGAIHSTVIMRTAQRDRRVSCWKVQPNLAALRLHTGGSIRVIRTIRFDGEAADRITGGDIRAISKARYSASRVVRLDCQSGRVHNRTAGDGDALVSASHSPAADGVVIAARRSTDGGCNFSACDGNVVIDSAAGNNTGAAQ
ncbi:hypothetical protein SDC9_57760 [bioreactor metagenome]|uniref:Uncharacterized protein n=1 Tax=bioreactor metagenome TaxID=1076179 RepID=A0A644X5J1_9ZZZZ